MLAEQPCPVCGQKAVTIEPPASDWLFICSHCLYVWDIWPTKEEAEQARKDAAEAWKERQDELKDQGIKSDERKNPFESLTTTGVY